jgi:regulator of protease activity HflC (stomatin/prohibitin superfamily)
LAPIIAGLAANRDVKVMAFSYAAWMLVLAVTGGVFCAVKIVPEGQEFTLERFGRYIRSLKPGLHVVLPLVDRVGRRINMREQVMDIPVREIVTRDNVVLRLDAVVFFQVLDAARAAYQISDPDLAILNLAIANLSRAVGSMAFGEVLAGREGINASLLQAVDEAASPWGVKIIRIEIKDIKPPAHIIQSSGGRAKAGQEGSVNIPPVEGKPQAAAPDAPFYGEPLQPAPVGKVRTGGWPEGSIPD